MGLVYDDLGEKQKALQYLKQALPILRAVGDKLKEYTILGNLADLEREQGNLQASFNHIENAIHRRCRLRLSH
ncbi:MAG: tetratricopeptide repeat protein [Cyanobacteria bacterium J06643_5]